MPGSSSEGDVFSLIGPKRYDAPWKELEALGWIAPAVCTEVRVELSGEHRMDYAMADPRLRHRLAATATEKLPVLDRILHRHADDQVLIIGQFIDQLRTVAKRLDARVLTGQTSQGTRDRHFDEFRRGELRTLVVSKIANFSIDLPEVAVAVQLSGQFGSRQDEAQRLGRLLRPKTDGGQAHFYTVVAPRGDTTPARVDVLSLAAVKRALDLLRDHGHDRHLLIAVMRILRDRAALAGEGVREGFDDLAAGRVVPLTDFAPELG